MEVSLSSQQSKDKITNDKIQNGNVGVGADANNGASTPSVLDELKTSWTNLKKSLGDLTDDVSGEINSGFTSAVETVKEPLLKTATSASNKVTSFVNLINEAIT
ncbi:Uncharacterised protein [Yersinia frederiksenii]|nr:Uncharacterised protein [Yersinia frederiksenii]